MSHDVFISHSTRDKSVADAVCAALESVSIRCWIAPRDVLLGRSYSGEITRAIQQSKVLVLIFSGDSNSSQQVLREVQLAANSGLHIVQFRIDSVAPNDDLEYYLSGPHWLDALTLPLQRHLETLQGSIKSLLRLPADGTARSPVTVDPRREERDAGTRAAQKDPPPRSSGTSQPVSTVWKWVAIAVAVTVFGCFGSIIITYRLRNPGATSKPEVGEVLVKSTPAAAPAVTPPPARANPESSRVNNSPASRVPVAGLVNDKEAEEFIRSFYRDIERDDVSKVLSYFDEAVDYYAYGRQSKAFIGDQLRQYLAALPIRSFSVGEIRLQKSSTGNTASAMFDLRYSLRGPGQGTTSTGRSHVDWDLVKRDGALKIVRFTGTSYPDASPAGSP